MLVPEHVYFFFLFCFFVKIWFFFLFENSEISNAIEIKIRQNAGLIADELLVSGKNSHNLDQENTNGEMQVSG